MTAPAAVEQHAHDLWRSAFTNARAGLAAATDALIRRCDAALPMLPPSLLAQPLDVSRWDRFVREEGLQPKRRGAPIEVLARRVRNALDVPDTRKMKLIVEAWLPDEDALRWVASVSSEAVVRWFEETRQGLAYWVRRPPFAPRQPGGALACAYECSLELARSFLGDARAERASGAVGLGLVAEHATALSNELRAWRVEPSPDEDEASRDVARNRDQVAYLLAQSFEWNARGHGESALAAYIEACHWSPIAGVAVDSEVENAIVRRYYDAPDVEAWIARA
ncbi:MAG: hypothetical protein JNK05_38120 [Myxococcales bacterium]|nr:hypothetical protein [Myxococcales bacterium]